MAASRRLAAIMFTDMVGYTASTQANEARTLELLREQEKLVRPLLKTHKGREIKSMGDGFLVEFDSALKAIQCAVDIQRRIYERNAQPGLAPFQIRIGIHLGDVEQRGTDILGDAVNIAARLEPIAEPGGICVSGAVHEQVWNKISDKLEKLLPKALKGLQVPIDIYRVVLPWTVEERTSPSSGPTRLAVLPFANISPDPKDEYFADGLTEELITVLSQLRELRVIARTSVTPYKSTSKGVAQIGAELGVDSVLEGSVRKAGDELRITVQLIDVGTQEHTWANTYDRKLEKVFAIQADIARQVAEALRIRLRAAEEARLESRPPVRPESYLAYLRGRTLMHDPTQPALESAKQAFELAISLDPNNAPAHSGLSDVIRTIGWWYSAVPREEWDPICRRLVTRAIELDPNLAEAHASLGEILATDHEYVSAEKEFKLALSLNPSYSLAHNWYAGWLAVLGRTEEALREFSLAEGADPSWSYNLLYYALLLLWRGRPDEALAKIEKMGREESFGEAYHAGLACYHLARSDLPRALQEFDAWAEKTTEPRWRPLLQSLSYALTGKTEQSRALLRQEETLPALPGLQWIIAEIYCELGDLDECFRWMDKTTNLLMFVFDPRLEPARRDPRYQAFLRKWKLA